VNHYKTQPPWEFLLSASRNSLQSYELSRLSHAANPRKEIGGLLDLWMEENCAAMLADGTAGASTARAGRRSRRRISPKKRTRRVR
jgi:hypothetical protein